MAMLLKTNVSFKLLNGLWVRGGWPRTLWMPNSCRTSPWPSTKVRSQRLWHPAWLMNWLDEWAHLATHLLGTHILQRTLRSPDLDLSLSSRRELVQLSWRTMANAVNPERDWPQNESKDGPNGSPRFWKIETTACSFYEKIICSKHYLHCWNKTCS